MLALSDPPRPGLTPTVADPEFPPSTGVERGGDVLFVSATPPATVPRRGSHPHAASTPNLVIVDDAAAARAVGGARRFDAVFVDLRDPRTDGAALLAELRQTQPDALRIAITDPDDADGAVRAAAGAHRTLPGPCDPGSIALLARHAAALKARVPDERIRLLVGGVGSLPSVPRVYAELTRLLAEPNVSIDEVARLVAEDTAVAARVLQVANSAFFGIGRQVTTLRSAVAMLGIGTIRSLALAAEVVRAFAGADRAGIASIERLQSHSLAVAALAPRLLPDRLDPDEVFAAALLHDVGKLVLLDRCPDLYAFLCRTAEQRGRPVHQVELAVLGVSHAEIGAYLLHLWNLPASMVAAVASHHLPSRPSSTETALVVHLADALVHGADPATPRGEDVRLDLPVVQQFGLADRLPGWQAMAAARRPADALLSP